MTTVIRRLRRNTDPPTAHAGAEANVKEREIYRAAVAAAMEAEPERWWSYPEIQSLDIAGDDPNRRTRELRDRGVIHSKQVHGKPHKVEFRWGENRD